MNQEGVDALIASTPENVGYLTGFWQLIQADTRFVEAYAVFPDSSEKPTLVTTQYALVSGANLIKPGDLKISPYGSITLHADAAVSEVDRRIKHFLSIESRVGAAEALMMAIREEGLGSATVGIENLIHLPTLKRLKDEFPKLRIKDATNIFYGARMVKTGDEIEKMRKAAISLERAIDITFQNITEGITEIEVANELKGQILKEGSRPGGVLVVEFGDNSPHVDTWPTDNRLKKGDIIHTDILCKYENYYGDTARTVVFDQEPTNKQKQYFDAVVSAQRAAIEMVKPGVKASEVLSVIDETIKKDIPHTWRVFGGHSIGLEVWEPPLLVPGDDTVLEKNMVINLEPLYWELGFGGFQVEDTLLVTETGSELLTVIDESLRI
jgi:Xaa-Pro aminopeptidase